MNENINSVPTKEVQAGQTLFGAVSQYRILFALLLFCGALALLANAYVSYRMAQTAYDEPTTINVEGEGEVVAVPDIATFSFSVRAEAEDPTGAQDESAKAINAITSFLEGEGIAETDIKTQNYNLSPKYEFKRDETCAAGEFCPGRQELVGYTVNQTIEVKVRDTERAGELIAGAGDRGATNISSLRFTIDDEDELKEEARKAAIADAKAKADVLADELDMRIVRVVSFWEDNNGRYPVDHFGFEESAADSAVLRNATAPSVPVGENTITSRVNIVYELR